MYEKARNKKKNAPMENTTTDYIYFAPLHLFLLMGSLMASFVPSTTCSPCQDLCPNADAKATQSQFLCPIYLGLPR